MRLSRTLTVAAASMAVLTFAASLAEAQTRRKGVPLTIQKRSFLDSGPVVPVGRLRNYVNDSTVLFVPTYRNGAPAKFGNETLPGRFDVPGRASPLFTF